MCDGHEELLAQVIGIIAGDLLRGEAVALLDRVVACSPPPPERALLGRRPALSIPEPVGRRQRTARASRRPSMTDSLAAIANPG